MGPDVLPTLVEVWDLFEFACGQRLVAAFRPRCHVWASRSVQSVTFTSITSSTGGGRVADSFIHTIGGGHRQWMVGGRSDHGSGSGSDT